MRWMSWAVMTAVAAVAVGQTPQPKSTTPPPIPPTQFADPQAKANDQAREIAKKITAELADLKNLVATVNDPATAIRLRTAVTRLESKVADLNAALTAAGGPAALDAIPASEFNKLVGAIRGQAFDDRKLPILKDALRTRGFTCEQGAQLVKLFSFSQGKIQAATLLHPRLTDPANFHDLLKALPFETDRDAVRKSLGLQ